MLDRLIPMHSGMSRLTHNNGQRAAVFHHDVFSDGSSLGTQPFEENTNVKHLAGRELPVCALAAVLALDGVDFERQLDARCSLLQDGPVYREGGRLVALQSPAEYDNKRRSKKRSAGGGDGDVMLPAV